MISKKISSYNQSINLDLQLLATELDSCVSNFMVISNSTLTDGIELSRFEKMLQLIKSDYDISSSFDDYTDIYCKCDMYVVIHEPPTEAIFLIFDADDRKKIEATFESL